MTVRVLVRAHRIALFARVVVRLVSEQIPVLVHRRRHRRRSCRPRLP